MLPSRLVPILLLCLAGLSLEARAAQAVPVERSEPTWFEISSPSFRVLSEAPVGVARQTLEALERLRPGVLGALGAKEATGAVDVILFASRDSYRSFAGIGSVAKTSWRSARPIMLLRTEPEGGPPRPAVLAHELTHALSHQTLGPQPRWIAEGLAELLEDMTPADTVGLDVRVPGPGASVRWTRKTAREVLPLETLWAWDERLPPRAQLPRYYTASWAWTAYLQELHPQRWQRFLGALGQGQVARDAFEEAFAGLSGEGLLAGVRAWVGKGRASADRVVPVPTQATSRIEQPLTLAESGVVRAWLRMLGFDGRALSERRRLAAAELTLALKRSPQLPSALMLQGLLGERWDFAATSLAELR